MKYCSECKRLCGDDIEVCENCGGAVADIRDDDKAFLFTASVIQRERIKIILEDKSIDLFEEANGRKTDLYVNYKDYDKTVDYLLDIDALPSDYKDKKSKKKAFKTAAEIRALEKKEAAEQQDESEADADGEAQNTDGTQGEEKPVKKTKKKDSDRKSRFEKILSEDDDKSVYELFGFQNLSKKKRIITAAVLWVIFGIVIFLLIAGVDMIMEFIRGLFQ